MQKKCILKKVFSFEILFLIVLVVNIISPLFKNCLTPACAEEKEKLFMADKSGKIYTSAAPSKKIEHLFPELFKEHPGKEWKIEVRNGFAKEIKMTQPLSGTEAEPKNISKKFIKGFSRLFGIEPEETSYSAEAKLKDEKNVTYRQVLNGLPVLNSYISFVFKKNGLNYIISRVHPDVKDSIPSTEPAITAEKACEISLNDAYSTEDLPGQIGCGDSELIIIPGQYAAFAKYQKNFYLAWKVSVSSKEVLFSYTYFIDASNGEVLNKYSNIRDSWDSSSQDEIGNEEEAEASDKSGNCREVDGTVYGSIFSKNKNETQWKEFKYLKTILKDAEGVTGGNGAFSLESCSKKVRFQLEGYDSFSFAKVVDCNKGPCEGVKEPLKSKNFRISQNGNYRWKTDNDNKKELTVFWHLNEIHDYFKNLLGQDLMDYQLMAFVDYIDKDRCRKNTKNAFYSGSEKDIYFCSSDISKESDVIYHEYTHGVIDHIPNYFLPYEDESGALNEGLADYFAAVKNDDPLMGEGIGTLRDITDSVKFNDRCTAPDGFYDYKKKKCMRNSYFTCFSSQYWVREGNPDRCNDYGYVHHNSLVVSGALWDLRENRGLNKADVDELVLKTVYNRKPETTIELMDGLIEEAPAYNDKIQATFATRGVKH